MVKAFPERAVKMPHGRGLGKNQETVWYNQIHARVLKAVRQNQNILASSYMFFKIGAIFATRPGAEIH